jgi:hypothetical protein
VAYRINVNEGAGKRPHSTTADEALASGTSYKASLIGMDSST